MAPQNQDQDLTQPDLKVANAMTIDVEDYFQVGVFQDRIKTDDWHSFESRVEHNLDRCLARLDAKGIKATFFVLGWLAERFPAAIRRLDLEGHEVASHGYGHQPIWKLNPESFREDIKRAQGEIGAAIGRAPRSYRAPCFSITKKTLWALDILAEEGIVQDSSIFPVSHPEYGIPDAEKSIHRIRLANGAELWEFPMTVGRLCGKTMAFCGGGWFRLFPYWVTRRALRKSCRDGVPFVFYLHPWELDPDQPDLRQLTTKLGRFRHYVNLHRNEAKFAQLLEDFTFTRLEDIFAAYAGRDVPVVSY
ncbi:MAG: XrtA system polysaccharide deacetylase [Planctomycetota bacterium]